MNFNLTILLKSTVDRKHPQQNFYSGKIHPFDAGWKDFLVISASRHLQTGAFCLAAYQR